MKKSTYLNIITGESEYLLHNTLYNTILKAKCEVTKSIVNALQENSFVYTDENEFHVALRDLKMIVDDDLDELALLDSIVSRINRDTLEIVLIVTSQCNFRCVYCYEKFSNNAMDGEFYSKLIDAIEYEVVNKGYKGILLSFFGGEPMLEYESIISFMKEIKLLAQKLDIKVTGAMTTNAYLLSKEKLAQLVNLDVKNYQITVDGLEESHNASRFLVSGAGTWSKIISNLKDAKESELDFNITIRTNFDADLAHDFNGYIELMSDYFSNDTRFTYYFESVKKLGGDSDDKIKVVENEATAIDDFSSLAVKHNLQVVRFGTTPFSGICYAAKSSSLVIDTAGNILKCTVLLESPDNKVGELQDGRFDVSGEMIDKWTAYELPQGCHDCRILPICYARACPPSNLHVCGADSDYCHNLVMTYNNVMKAKYPLL